MHATIQKLQRRIAELEQENCTLYSRQSPTRTEQELLELSAQDIERYSQQMILGNGFGVQGQRRLFTSSVLVVGAGGIGSAVLPYLAGAGVGTIGVVDFDQVEISNLHRQVIHHTTNATSANNKNSTITGTGMNKAVSAQRAIGNLNPNVRCIVHETMLTHDNAMDVIQPYDIVVDASDNPQTRYLINDACVLLSKLYNKRTVPLVSASAVGTEGQLTVYNYNNHDPCYRCMFPNTSSTTGVSASCSDAGVLGPVPGVVGILQAVETIKILTEWDCKEPSHVQVMSNRLLMYDALRCSFLSIKKPPRRPNCVLCGDTPTIRTMQDSRNDLAKLRGPSTCERPVAAPLPDTAIISCQDYHDQVRVPQIPHVLLDVRVKQQFEMCHLPGAINIPLQELPTQLDRVQSVSNNGTLPIYCICRRGIASTKATQILLDAQQQEQRTDGTRSLQNIRGGLNAWHHQVDQTFPMY